MTGLWLEYLFWDEKAIQMLPRRMPSRRRAAWGPRRSCARGDPHQKLDWQGGLVPAPGHAPLKSWKGITCFRDEIWELPLCESFKLFEHWENKDMWCKCCKDKRGEDKARISSSQRNRGRTWRRALGREAGRPPVPGWADSLSSLFSTGDFWHLNRNGRWGYLQKSVEHGTKSI